jgi:short-subunit dehydrogenase involved in D-alanine esterification of teichoic acids
LSSRSALITKGTSPPGASFAQQFNYHLQDLAIVRRNQTAKPDGQLTVHLPSLQSVRVDYNRREMMERFRERLQTAVPDLRINNHYVVSNHGLIADRQTLDEYFLTPGADVLIIPKGVRNKQHFMRQRF